MIISELPSYFERSIELPASLPILEDIALDWLPHAHGDHDCRSQPYFQSRDVQHQYYISRPRSSQGGCSPRGLSETNEFDLESSSSSTITPDSPPPPYFAPSSPILHAHISMQKEDLLLPDNVFDAANHRDTGLNTKSFNNVWTCPITRACQSIMRDKFPTATVALFDAYNEYRQQVRNKKDYKWFLQFRYTSFVLEVDLPFKVFLVRVNVYVTTGNLRANKDTSFPSILAYLFEDCVVFARSPFTDRLPEPCKQAANTRVSPVLESGLEVLDDFCIHFDQVRLAAKVDKRSLLISCFFPPSKRDIGAAPANDKQRENPRARPFRSRKLFYLEFSAKCQRDVVLNAISRWL
ncbi:hypothetical protein H2198_000910 [Neophaeococcomyces mojaviensis]|uniref:Uncharacterized protein n=1 Tax=Neophaeococcomyces mojaviensis TaxID=3383035 RepID=A0ACC3AIA6_9EURO|nr:hypothetical protein H2198_000910 [Knufia sp. JES_112]